MRHGSCLEGKLRRILYMQRRGKCSRAALPHCPLSRLLRRHRWSGLQRLPTLDAEASAAYCGVAGRAPTAQWLTTTATEGGVRDDDSRAARPALVDLVDLVDIVLMHGRHARGIPGAAGRATHLAAPGPRGYVAGQPETHDDPKMTARYPGESGEKDMRLKGSIAAVRFVSGR